ncbi:hypothetical protein DEO72_LG5g2533 [Vigna unguiculata]|uniref:Uncharacterized protein n=1 Tax=Vigna unguiculata TaxID=3917 RepID=A0A4D6LZM8_VIGUN|nr:hypothetical protein DEO72_LG5g2533 [Vigna unguiculata]
MRGGVKFENGSKVCFIFTSTHPIIFTPPSLFLRNTNSPVITLMINLHQSAINEPSSPKPPCFCYNLAPAIQHHTTLEPHFSTKRLFLSLHYVHHQPHPIETEKRESVVTTEAPVSLTNIVAVGLCSILGIRGEDARPARTSSAGGSLDGGSEVVRRENNHDGLEAKRAKPEPGRNPHAEKEELAPLAARFGRGSGGVHGGSCRRCVGVGLSELRSGA